MIVLEKLEGDKLQAEICKLYWEYKGQDFVWSPIEIADTFGLTETEVAEIVAVNSIAYWHEYICGICAAPLMYFTDRRDFYQHREVVLCSLAEKKAGRALFLCRDCFLNRPVNLNRASLPLGIGASRRYELEQAFYKAEYFKLDCGELDFLKILAGEVHYSGALSQAKLAPNDAAGIVEVLVKHNLISFGLNGTGYWMAPQLLALLQEKKLAVRSPFCSLEELKAFRILRSKHLFVYPRVPISAFVASDQITDLYDQPWCKAWFLSYNFDFVITNREGVPQKVIDLGEKNDDTKEQFINRILDRLNLPREKWNE